MINQSTQLDRKLSRNFLCFTVLKKKSYEGGQTLSKTMRPIKGLKNPLIQIYIKEYKTMYATSEGSPSVAIPTWIDMGRNQH